MSNQNVAENSTPDAEEKIPMSIEKKDAPKKNFLEIACPYCYGANFFKRGTRQKKNEIVQLYLCRDCQKTFTPGSTKGKHYPISVILDAISLYYIGYSIEKVAERTKKIINANKTDIDTKMLGTGTVLEWINEYEPLCAFARMRPHALKLFPPEQTISSATLAHRQLYRFRHHRSKTILIIQEDWKHSKFWPLKEFLDLVPIECPHQYFQEGARASETPLMFSKTEMIVRGKHNFANKMAKFVLESVEEPKARHDALQRFMLANDSVTIATEVPIYLRREDLAHMQTQLGFELYKKQTTEEKKANKDIEKYPAEDLPKLITGHIDFIQVRNGQIHILDYKPNAAKERPIEQLTIYALALSRLTGLKVFNFKCAWFDEKDYFEFFPLHVVHKPDKRRRKRKITTIEGNYKLNDNPKKIESVRAK
ncbi:MAG: PD-(D/E)XK nuclease family protein [Candidatus Moraniibacteriota bacterium]